MARGAGAMRTVVLVARLSAEDTNAPAPPQAMANRVAATVGGVEIYAAQVERFVQRILGQQTVDVAVRNRAQAEALEQLIKQQIVLASLERQGAACSQQQLDLAIAQFKEELVRQDKTLEDYCQSMGIPVAAFEQAVRWQLSWDRYLQKSLTEENLQRYFADHRRDFDGTRLRVAQILFTLPDNLPDQPAAVDEVRQQAQTLREEILAGTVSFAEAARKRSQSPSAQSGGELSRIARHEPMPEVFSQAAYRLQVGEISPPVVSPVGVHLIKCLEIEPGTRTWQEVREPLTAAVREHLYAWNADRPGEQPEVRFTGATPHFRLGTRELVLPETDRHVDSEQTGK